MSLKYEPSSEPSRGCHLWLAQGSPDPTPPEPPSARSTACHPHTSIYTPIRLSKPPYVRLHPHTSIHIHTRTFTPTHVHLHTHMSICTQTRTSTPTHVYSFANAHSNAPFHTKKHATAPFRREDDGQNQGKCAYWMRYLVR